MSAMDALKNQKQGGCLCGAVRYKVSGQLRGVVNCHCSMCRSLHGIYGAHTKTSNADLDIYKQDTLRWYDCGDNIAVRGFCTQCGTNLFWRPLAEDNTAIVVGSLDDSNGLQTVAHIFVEDKANFYEITDALPQYPQGLKGKSPS